MKTRLIQLLAVVAMTFATGHRALAAQESAAQEPTVPIIDADDDTTPATSAAPPPGWWERDTLTGDWGGGRSRLQEHGIRLRPQFTQFYQGLASGDGIRGYEYGGKFSLLLNADAARLGMWDGLSFTVHAEYNFGETANGRGGHCSRSIRRCCSRAWMVRMPLTSRASSYAESWQLGCPDVRQDQHDRPRRG